MRYHVYESAASEGDSPSYNIIEINHAQADKLIADNLTKENAELIVKALEREPESPDYAVGILRRDYYSDVADVVSDLIARIKSGEIEDEDDLQTAIHEDIDGHQRIIYTFQAKISLLCSDNEDAGEEDGCLGDKPTVEQRAFCAMRRDVEERLAAEGVDLSDPGALREEEDEEGEDKSEPVDSEKSEG